MKAIFSTGGTGGHIFPAIAVADELKRSISDAEILFVGAQGKMEMTKVANAGYTITGLPVRGMRRNFSFGNIVNALNLVKSVIKAGQIIKRFKPDLVIGFGAFASAPIMIASKFFKTQRYIHEQNAYPGLVNKYMSNKVDKVFTGFRDMKKYFSLDRTLWTGNPVRVPTHVPSSVEAKSHFNIPEHAKVIFLTGGSLGARTLNQSIETNLEAIDNNGDTYWIWQCGSRYFTELENLELPKNILIKAFIDDMSMAYAAADLVCARAGALTLAELAYWTKPALIIPSPNVAEDHQTKNAIELESNKACLMISDSEAKTTLVTSALDLVNNADKLTSLSKHITKFRKPDAAQQIVSHIINQGAHE